MARGLINRSKRRSVLIKATSAVALGLPLALAAPSRADSTWTGLGANTNFDTPENWESVLVPAPGDNLIFGTGGSTATMNVPYSAGLVTINRTANFTIDGGSALTIGTGITMTGGTGVSDTISAPIVLGGPSAWNIGNNVSTTDGLTVTGGITGPFGITRSGSRTLTINTGQWVMGGDFVQNGGTNPLAPTTYTNQGSFQIVGEGVVNIGAPVSLNGGA